MKQAKKSESVFQIVAPVPRKTNGVKKNGAKKSTEPLKVLRNDKARSYDTRFIPRYLSIPAMPENVAEPTFSESSTKILKERYLKKDDNLQTIETISERFWNIAYDIASADFDFSATEKQVYNQAVEFYNMMVRQEFLPNSPTIMNSGKQNGLQYSACFVLPIDDSIPGIFDTMKYAALIHQSGGGTGFAFSRLRPNGSTVKSSMGIASGPVSFLRVYDAATQSIKQGGTRRGANMGILRIDHPDILEFIRSKSELDEQNQPVYDGIAPFLPSDEARDYFKTLLLDRQISNFNISAALTDKFMDAYYKGGDYELINPHNKKVAGTLNAKAVMDEIVERAWRTGDPGLIFIDRINHSPANPSPDLEEIESTNPCGEQPLAPWDACNLGSINLGKFVLEDGSDVDWQRLKDVTHKTVRFLDDVVQTNPYTLQDIYDEVHRNRRIGLGVMGWADMLFRLKIAYDSDQAIELGEKVMKFINDEGHKESEDLALKRGPFPNWTQSIYRKKNHPSFSTRGESYAYDGGRPIRNSTVTTIAPTGSISIIGDCSSGIEPVFALAYIHRAKTGGSDGKQMRILTIANKTFTEIAQREGFYSEDLAQKVLDHGSVRGVDDVPTDWQQIFTTAPEIDSDSHVKMQAAFQKYTDNGVSKTINLPNSSTVEDVRRAYMMAWETGCNGITVYRDGSKTTQVLNVSSTLTPARPAGGPKTEQKQETAVLAEIPSSNIDPREGRPLILRGRTYEIMTPVGKGFVTVNRDDRDQPFEVFITVGKGGMHTMADAEAIGRLTSIALRVARNNRREIAEKIIQQLRGIGGASHIGFGKDRVMSLADAVAKVLAEDMAYSESHQEDPEALPLDLADTSTQGSLVDDVIPQKSAQADLCPECGQASFVREDGCEKCYSCGYSKC